MHERSAVRALAAVASGDRARAAHELQALERDSRITGHGLFRRIAHQIASSDTIESIDLPHMFFVTA